MKKFMSVVVLTCFAVVFGFAQNSDSDAKPKPMEGTWHGYVVDAMCAKGIVKKSDPMERAAKHTKECLLEESCAASGYGLFYEGAYYKFDEAGDKMAKSAIEKSKSEKGLMFDVTGAMEGDRITVASMSEMKSETGKKSTSKKTEKKTEHKQ